MKSKGSASLYEVLKSASRPGADAAADAAPAAAPSAPSADGQMTLQERLAAYKAQKLAAATSPATSASATAVADPTPVPVAVAEPVSVLRPATQFLTPIATAPSVPEPQPETKPSAGPGERVLRMTYNTIAFAALVGVGLMFVAYAVGVKVGRSRAAEGVETASVTPIPKAPPVPIPPAPPPAAPKVYTIHLVEWPARNSEQRLKAADAADVCKKTLERQGFKNVETMKITRSGEERLAMYIDRFKDVSTESARSRLLAIQKLKVANQAVFAQAAFEEVPK